MKLLFVNMSVDPVKGGGTAMRTIQLALHLAALGNHCTILSTDCGMSENDVAVSLRNPQLVIKMLPCFNKRFYVPKFPIAEIYRLVKTSDLIHLMGHWTILNALVYWYVRFLKKPYVICPAGALPIFGRSRLLKQLYNALVGHQIVRNAYAHIAIADNEFGQFAQYGIKTDRITLIPNGVNPADYQNGDPASFRDKFGLGNTPYILYMGRLNAIKGPDLLLEAFQSIAASLPAIHLVFAGPDGGMEEMLRDNAQDAATRDRVHFIGYIGGEDKVAAYRGASLLAVPSRQEAMSIVAIEAGICGTPVLMTDQCGFDEVETVGGGRVVATTVQGIADGLVNMLYDQVQLANMGASFRRYVKQRYTWNIAASSCQKLFEKVSHK